jgi:hypothetical protein
MMKSYTQIQAEHARNQASGFVPPPFTPASVKQTPVEIPGVMYQSANLYQPVVIQPPKDTE